MDFIDQHRDRFGVESICKMLPIAPSTYFAHAARHRNPDLRSDRAKCDAALMPEVQRVYHENFAVYGVRKVWRQLPREDIDVARRQPWEIVETCLVDSRLAWKLDADGNYVQRRPQAEDSGAAAMGTHHWLMDAAARRRSA